MLILTLKTLESYAGCVNPHCFACECGAGAGWTCCGCGAGAGWGILCAGNWVLSQSTWT